MELPGYLVSAVVTLAGVIGILWRRDQVREKAFEGQRRKRDEQIRLLAEDQKKAEEMCRGELAEERKAREAFQRDTIEWMKVRSERDQQVFVNLQHALERLGSSVSEQRRDIRRLSGEHHGDDPRSATTVYVPAITGK
jgi:hypothetical protein